MAERIGTFIIREAGGLRFANSLVLGRGLQIDTTEGEIPELTGTDTGTTFTGVKAYPSMGLVPLPNLTETSIPLDTVEIDSDNFFNSAQPTRLTVPAGLGGVYMVVARGSFSANAGGMLAAGFRLNGTAIKGITREVATNLVALTATEIIRLEAGDYLELRMFQDSGATISAFGGLSYESSLMMTRLGA
jgi:hypothetical protein